MLNASIIPEWHFTTGLNLVIVYLFAVGEMGDESSVIRL
jgi:hypothetical protein